MPSKQWNDVEEAISEGRCEDAGVAIGEIIKELNADLDWEEIQLLTDAIEGEF